MSSLVDHQPMILTDKKRGRHDDDGGSEDRLSDLPDCVLLHILSFLNNSKQIVQTCILSTKWNHIWKRALPTLILHYYYDSQTSLDIRFSSFDSGFSSRKSFDEFVSKILQLRDDSITLHTFELERDFSTQPNEHGHSMEPRILKEIACYILSHSNHLHRLAISIKGEMSSLILPSISACHTLTSLKLSLLDYIEHPYGNHYMIFPKSLNLPSLTTLDLTYFIFCADENDNDDLVEPFSSFKCLNSLIISTCNIRDAKVLSITSETLVSLSMVRNYRPSFTKIKLCAPSLCTLTFTGGPDQKLCGSSLSSVKHLNMDIYGCGGILGTSFIPITWLLDLSNIMSLTVMANALLIIAQVPDVLKLEFPSLCNLKALKVKMNQDVREGFPSSHPNSEKMLLLEAIKSWKEASNLERPFNGSSNHAINRLDRIGKMVGFLCQNSPSAQVDFIEHHF